MSDTITRRSALRTGALASLAAGMLGSAVPTEAAQPLPTPTLATVVNADDLAAEAGRRWVEVKAALGQLVEFQDEITARVSWDVANPLFLAESDYNEAHSAWVMAELARHLPGLAPALLMLEHHIIETAYQKPGACCTVDEGYEA